MFDMKTPIFMIRHPDLINRVLVKDFDHFLDHRAFFNEDHDALFGNTLFALKNQKWKDMRATLTPAYTGSKLRAMFELIREVAEESVSNLKEELKSGLEDVDCRDYFTRYANDVIATTAFGFKINSMQEKDNQFFKMGQAITNFGAFIMAKFFFLMNFRSLSKFLKIRLISQQQNDYYMNLVVGAMNQRFEQNIFRPDMINMLMEASGRGVQDSCDSKSIRKWSDSELVAQAFLFFLSGFDSVSTVLCFISQELMENKDVQAKLRQEIDDVLSELNGKQLTYEILNSMKYMDCVVSEALRKWPLNPMTDRVCTKTIEMQDPETGESIKIKAGEKIFIPIVGIQRDPKYFPEPSKFDPERFSDENKASINPNTFLPFGIGPRMCIAHRFAYMEIKAILFYMLCDLNLEISEKSCVPLTLDSALPRLQPKNGFWVKMVE
ncbi:hypothetical protein ACFFRR_000597 [Megaselia abdita]